MEEARGSKVRAAVTGGGGYREGRECRSEEYMGGRGVSVRSDTKRNFHFINAPPRSSVAAAMDSETLHVV